MTTIINAQSFIQIVKGSRKEQVANFGTWFPASADGASLKAAIDNKVLMLESQLNNLKQFKDSITAEQLDEELNRERATKLLSTLSKEQLKAYLAEMG